jgi:hypothetical protein
VAVCPLRPATDLRLGGPLPHQLANQPRAPSSAIFTFLLSDLCGISFGFPKLFPTKEWIPTCYSPVRHFTHGLLHFLVRLACVKRAANVDSEPGSNSQFNCLSLSIWSGNLQISFPYLAELKVRRNCFASNQIVKHLCSPTGIFANPADYSLETFVTSDATTRCPCFSPSTACAGDKKTP